MRCVHEAQLHEQNNFLTLTYSNEYLPKNYSLVKSDLQKFLKRYRKKCGKIRYLACGEYGPKTKRPHYHLIIFGHDWPDRQILTINKNNDKIYTSKILREIWPYGNHAIGDVTFESSAYVARYIIGKITGKDAKEAYERYDSETGEIWNVEKEFNTMSRRPGIGRAWYDKYKTDVYPSDNIHLRGISMRPPKYYDRAFELEEPEILEQLKKERVRKQQQNKENNTPERLAVREKVAQNKLKQLVRPQQ